MPTSIFWLLCLGSIFGGVGLLILGAVIGGALREVSDE